MSTFCKCLVNHYTKMQHSCDGRWCLSPDVDLQGTASPVRYVVNNFFSSSEYVYFSVWWNLLHRRLGLNARELCLTYTCTWVCVNVYYFGPWDSRIMYLPPLILGDFWRQEMRFPSIFDFSQWCVTIIFLNNNVWMQISVLVGCSMCRDAS